MQHALSSCQTALAHGRYICRHDTVLRELADTLERERRKKRNTKRKACPATNFVKDGQTGKKTKAPTTSILDESDCWEMKVDLGRQLVFPNIIHTAHRPDIVIWSPNDRKLVMVELTVPWETRCEEAYERKMAKYTELQEQYWVCLCQNSHFILPPNLPPLDVTPYRLKRWRHLVALSTVCHLCIYMLCICN